MATDSTNVPQGELNFDAGSDMAGNELEFGAVQLAQVTADAGQPVQLPQGQQVVLVPVQPGQTLTLPTAETTGLLAKIGPEGNLSIVVDGRTIIFQGYVRANEESPVRIVTTDGDVIDVADVVAATDPNLDIQTAAGPAAGGQGDTVGNGIYTPFVAGPPLGGLNAIGVLDPTALQYRLIDDERRLFTKLEDESPDFEISFDVLGGIVNEDDLTASFNEIPRDQVVAFLMPESGNGDFGNGNDPFDTKDREPGSQNNPPDENDVDDNNPDPDKNVDDDREPLTTVATVTVDFHGEGPGTLVTDTSLLPTGLKSEGEDIVYEVIPAGGGVGTEIIGFVDGNGDGHFDELDGDRKVFDAKVDKDVSDSVFKIAFTLYDNIDNAAPDANGDGKADLLGGDEQILGLPVNFTITDSNGSSVVGQLPLGVEDDIPFFGETAYTEGSGGVVLTIENEDAGIVHDESPFPQKDADDKSIFDWEAGPAAFEAGIKVVNAGFSFPYGDSIGAIFGIAQSKVAASFGADQSSREDDKLDDDATARNSIFGELEDRTDADGDGNDDGENEQPFELFMIEQGKGSKPTEDNLNTVGNEGNLTIADQLTNATVSWNGEQLQVWVHQIDAQTIVGYVIVEGDEQLPEAAAAIFDGEDGGKEAVFVLTIDDQGNLTFVQYHQINHLPNGDPSSHDEDFQILGEDGTPIIQVRISDYDGDHATQPVNLVIQDDGPKVVCDFDCVTEGDVEGEPNAAIGNVVTGANWTVFGADGNFLDGNKDYPGVDKPHTISKIGHDGVTYFLNTPEVGDPFVTKGGPAGDPAAQPLNGTTETFDPATGILHIPTEKGGTFEIVMISDYFYQVGDYKYTVPESAEHEHGGDKLVGPADAAESNSAAFSDVGEWVSAFDAGGITLQALVNGAPVPGSLGVKNVTVAGPNYRGIGVDVPGDFADEEVDTQGPQSLKLTLQPGEFGAGTDNAKLTLGALFDGQQHDDGFQEIVLWQVFKDGVPVASGQILGDFDGLVTLDIDTNGQLFNEIVLTPLSNGSFGDIRDNSDFVLVNFETCCPTNKFIEEFDYTLRDVDGDEASTTLKIGVEDTEPSIPYVSGNGDVVYVDEDGLPAGIGDNGSKYDDPATSASASGFISFTPGADPVTIELSVGNGGDTGLKTLDDQRVFAAWDAESNTLVGYIEGTNPLDPANQVFKVEITDAQTGAFSFYLLQPLQHSDTDTEDGDDTENLQDLVLDINVQIEDQDCDVAYTTLKVVIDDDMPLADLIAITVDPDGDGKLVHDETPGVQNNGNSVGDPGASGEDEDDVAGPLAAFSGLETAETLSAIGYASTVIELDLSGGISPDKAYGADGPGHAELALTKADGSDFDGDLTNLASNGEPIFLFTEDGLVVGRIGAGGVADENGDVVFALSLNSDTGAFDLAQYLPIDQLDPTESDEAITLLSGDDAGGALVYATATVTDADGDTVTKSIAMDGEEGNPAIQFQDHLEYDDVQPIAYDDKVCVVEPQTNANILLVFDRSGSMNDPSGIPGLTKLEAAKEAAKNMLTEYAALGGDVRVMLVLFNNNATREGSWLSVAQALAAIDDIDPSDDNARTSYQDAIETAIAGFNDTDGRGETSTHPGVVYFLSDGQPTIDGNPDNDGDGLPNFGITPATLTTWNTLLENDANNVDHVYAVGFGGGIPDGANNVHLNAVANPDNDAAPGDPNGTVLFVSNLADLETTLVDTVGTDVSGNILDGTIEDDSDGTAGQDPDYEGNAPAHISSFAYTGAGPNAITITWTGVGLPVVVNGVNVTQVGTDVSFDTDHGRMTFHVATGDFTFVPDVVAGGDKHEVFTYFITDNDNDVSNSATLDICITDLAPIAPVVVPQEQDPEGFRTSSPTDINFSPWVGTNGRDNVDLGGGNDTGNGGGDHDRIQGGSGDDVLTGSSGNDHLEGENDNDTLNGGTGNDLLDGGSGTDTLNGDEGNDLLLGGDGIDTLNGGEGNDELFGGGSADILNGGAGNDYLHGEADGALDKLFGGDGDDWLDVAGSDLNIGRQIDGGAGADVLDIGGFDLTGSAGITNIEVINMEGSGSDENVTLTAADVIAMTDANNTLFIWGSGGVGNDDDLHLLNSDSWVLASDNLSSNGRTYDVYHSGNATIAVDIDVDVNFS